MLNISYSEKVKMFLQCNTHFVCIEAIAFKMLKANMRVNMYKHFDWTNKILRKINMIGNFSYLYKFKWYRYTEYGFLYVVWMKMVEC